MVDAVTFGGVRLSASMDVTSGKLLPTGQPGEYKAGGNYTLDDASPVYVEAILMPVGTAEGITVNVHVDGRDFTYALPPTHVWNPGMIYTYTLNMKSGYNCEVDVDHVPMDEEYWSTFGKTDRIVMRDCGTDRIYIWPNYTEYGYDTYTGEGKVWGFFLRYRNRGGGEDFAGQARFVLMDGNRIVEQYQPLISNAETVHGTDTASIVMCRLCREHTGWQCCSKERGVSLVQALRIRSEFQ